MNCQVSQSDNLRPFLFRVLSIALLASLCGCSSMFFHPEKKMIEDGRMDRFSREDVWIDSGGNKLHGWRIEPTEEPKGTLLFYHGNAGNVSSHFGVPAYFADGGWRVYSFDYRGYGNSEGEPTIRGVNEDAAAMLDYVCSLGQAETGPLWVLGQSLGGALAIRAVAVSGCKERIKLLVSDSAFAGYRRIAGDKAASFLLTWPFQWFVSSGIEDDWSPERFAADISPVQLLLIHGMADTVVPAEHAQHLYDAAAEPKGLWLVKGAKHIGGLRDGKLQEELRKVLDRQVSR